MIIIKLVNNIYAAKAILNKIVLHTPTIPLSMLHGIDCSSLFAKLELFQVTGAFKVRGAYNKLYNLLTEKETKQAVRRNGVVAFSSGNHAAGVAYASKILGVKSTIVMPSFSIPKKVDTVRQYGGEVVMFGDDSDQSACKAYELSKEKNAYFLHPFDDPLVIAGQGTIGLELIEDLSELDMVIVPVSGGGLISGISIILKHINPKIIVIGVQPIGSAAMYESLQKGRIVELDGINTLADGLTAKSVGLYTYQIVKDYVNDIVLVSEQEIALAVKKLAFGNGILCEPAGAVAMAALLFGKVKSKGRKIALIISGRNLAASYFASLLN